MSADKASRPPSSASLAVRSPLTPRIAANNATTTTSTVRSALPRTSATRPPAVSSRLRLPHEDAAGAGDSNITPRAAIRTPRVVNNAQSPPSHIAMPADPKPKTSSGVPGTPLIRGNVGTGNVFGSGSGSTGKPRIARPKSSFGEHNARPATIGLTRDGIDNRFFHASDVQRQEPVPRKPEPKKGPTFFYADGKQDKPSIVPRAPSPVLSSVSAGPRARPEASSNPSKSPPMLSPSLAAAMGSVPFFNPSPSPQGLVRSPSPSKENIHLSYRKGVSQVLLRPTLTPPTPSVNTPFQAVDEVSQRQSYRPHRKSPSLSSIDSGGSQKSRRRSATSIEPVASPLALEVASNSGTQRSSSLAAELPSIDTSLASPLVAGTSSQGPLSPTKHASELAAEARRERKVLDLEISNSSLLAINASLEREVRRQKAELKRFRRLSRAGHISTTAPDFARRSIEGSDSNGEEDDDAEYDPFASAFADDVDDMTESEDEDEPLNNHDLSSSENMDGNEQDRLARDEKRLRVDLQKHKELLTQSQAMNQSLKRCMYATEEMIRDGRKALEYSVQVSDVKLGGRILTGHEEDDDDDMAEVEDEATDGEGEDGMESAKGFLDLFRGVGRSMEGSEGSGDRDSGIEVDKPLPQIPAEIPRSPGDSGRPPGPEIGMASPDNVPPQALIS